MKNRKWILVVSLVMAVAMSLTGTLAYLTDTASTVNVMTMGNVDIEQLENGKAEGGFATQPLYPAYYTTDANNQITSDITGKLTKEVTVKNIGDSEVYLRTWIAMEAGNLNNDFESIIHAYINSTDYTLDKKGIMEIGGVNYYVICATYNNKLAAGATTVPSLKSVYMDKHAENKHVVQFGDTYEILVLTQAMQTTNLESLTPADALKEGFGDKQPWGNGEGLVLPTATVKTASELREALTEGGKTVVLANDIELDADETITIAKDKAARLDLAGHTLSGESNETGKNANMIDVQGTLTVNNGKMEYKHTGANMGWNNSTNIFNVTAGGVLNLNGVNAVNKGGSDMAFVAHLNNWGEVTLNVNDSKLESSYIAVRVFNSGYDMNNVSVHNSTLAGKYSLWVHNYTPVDFGTVDNPNPEKAEAQKKLLNFDIDNGTNTFIGSVLYGFTNSVKDENISAKLSANSVKGLEEALESSEPVEIYVAPGVYTFPSSSIGAGDTIICGEGTVFEGTSGLDINGATVVGATFSNASGYAVSGTIDGTFKDCTFESGEALRWCYTDAGDEVVFENCVIKTNFRGFHFDGMKGNVTFKNCTIAGFNACGGEGTLTLEGCTLVDDESGYNGLNLYCNTVLKDCTFIFKSGDSNFIDMEGTGKTLTITNCTATLDGAAAKITDFVGGSKIAENTVTVDGVTFTK